MSEAALPYIRAAQPRPKAHGVGRFSRWG